MNADHAMVCRVEALHEINGEFTKLRWEGLGCDEVRERLVRLACVYSAEDFFDVAPNILLFQFPGNFGDPMLIRNFSRFELRRIDEVPEGFVPAMDKLRAEFHIHP